MVRNRKKTVLEHIKTVLNEKQQHFTCTMTDISSQLEELSSIINFNSVMSQIFTKTDNMPFRRS